MPDRPPGDTRTLWSWALYDFANSAFTTLVITFIYATYFVQGIAPDETAGTVLWSWGVVAPTAILVALLSPVLGALADRTGTRKRALLITTVITVLATAALFFPQEGDVLLAIVLVVIANIAFEIGQVFYNAFLPEIAPADRIGRVSGRGWALGYVGGLLCMAIALALVMPEVPPLGLDKATAEPVRATNLLVALWFAVFSIPAFLFLREPPATGERKGAIRATFSELGETFRHIRRYRQVVRLLVARLFYNDGLVTIFAMGGIFAATAYAFTVTEILFFGIVLNVAAGIGAFALASLDDRIGGRKTIFLSLGLLSLATVIAVFGGGALTAPITAALGAISGAVVGLFGSPESAAAAAAYMSSAKGALWFAGALIGIGSGPNQAASRSLLGRFVPHDKETEFYGFFAFSGKATAFAGPMLFGLMTTLFGTQRAGVAAVLGLFALGAVFLYRVDEEEGKRMRAESLGDA